MYRTRLKVIKHRTSKVESAFQYSLCKWNTWCDDFESGCTSINDDYRPGRHEKSISAETIAEV